MEITPIRSSSARRTIAVAICTYQRNEALTNLLEALLISAAHVAGLAAVFILYKSVVAFGFIATFVITTILFSMALFVRET